MDPKVLQEKIVNGFTSATVAIDTNDNVHFDAVVVTDEFEGKGLLARQRLVYAIIGDDISSGELHAVSLKTFTNQEWQKKCEN